MRLRSVWLSLLFIFLLMVSLSMWFDCKLEKIRQERQEMYRMLEEMYNDRGS